ncbi:MAG: nuclear transport factor 2 family protein [Dehalococcoidia bacterium]|nr:nuclear transport factor 2 family protein [Dehalococcoidia bacterium]
MEQEVLAANDAFYRAFNERDLEAMDALWAQTVSVSCIHPGWNRITGRETVIESWRGILSNPEQPRVVTGGAAATVLGDTAIVTCRELVGSSPLTATNIFVHELGQWRLIHHHSGPVAYAATS